MCYIIEKIQYTKDLVRSEIYLEVCLSDVEEKWEKPRLYIIVRYPFQTKIRDFKSIIRILVFPKDNISVK